MSDASVPAHPEHELGRGLHLKDVRVHFGGLRALDGVDLHVAPGTIMGLIGPNGAGKTTVLNCVSRFSRPSSGRVSFDGIDLATCGPHDLARLGVARTFQHLELFAGMTVRENILVGLHAEGGAGFLSSALGLPTFWRSERDARRRADDVIEFLELGDHAHWPLAVTPLDVRKRVDLGRALALKPRLLLLDEPASGLRHDALDQLQRFVRRVRDELHASVLLIEHNMPFVMGLCDRITVLEFGRTIAEGTPDEVRENPDVIASYLGKRDRGRVGNGQPTARGP